MSTLPSSIAPQAPTLPAPSIGTAQDGGLGYYELVDRGAFTYVQVGPLVTASDGDTVNLMWDRKSLALHSVTLQDLEQGVFSVAVNNGRIADRGDGIKAVTYTLTHTQGGGEETSNEVSITVKRTMPGGLDPHPETAINENLPPVTLSPHPVPGDATEVVVSVPLWLNAAVGDVMVVSWNGANFLAPPLTEPLPDPVPLTVLAADILKAGVGPAVPITWGVHDVVNNWSMWAATFEADVRIEDPGSLYAPLVGDATDGWTVLDLDLIGSADVKVFTPVYQGHALDDQVTVHWVGSNAAGEPLEYHTEPQPVTKPGVELRFDIPNAKATALAGGNLRVSYSVTPKAGGGDLPSVTVYLPVTGATQELPAPVVREAVDGQLDPDDAVPSAHTDIAVYPGIAPFDTVTLIWEGTAGDGAPVRYTAERQLSDITQPMTFVVPQAEVLAFQDGQAEVYYLVKPFTRSARRSLRALTERESARLPLTIRHVGAELPLPAPSVDNVVDGRLDPATEEAVMRAPAYPDIAKGDEVTYTWLGTVSTFTTTVKVGSTAVAPPGYVARQHIEDNIGGEVKVSYTVRRGGLDPAVPSDMLAFTVAPRAPIDFGADGMMSAMNYCVAEGRPPRDPQGNATYTRVATGGTPPYTYASANPMVATIDANGKVRACGNGTAELTATDAMGAKGTHTVTVTGAKVFRHIAYTGKRTYDVVEQICNSGGWIFTELSDLKRLWSQYAAEGPVATALGWTVDGDATTAAYWTQNRYMTSHAWVYDLNGSSVDGNGQHRSMSEPYLVVVQLK